MKNAQIVQIFVKYFKNILQIFLQNFSSISIIFPKIYLICIKTFNKFLKINF